MRPNRPVTAALCAAALALTAAACGPGDGEAGGDAKPTVAASLPSGADGIKIPDELKDKLKEHGFDLEKWRGGAWKNWNQDDWLREAGDYVNPIIEDLWDPDRMRGAEEPKAPPSLARATTGSNIARDSATVRLRLREAKVSV
ncbi:hypothetical protein ACWD0G_24565, partial [Streptomyces goshikiensis]